MKVRAGLGVGERPADHTGQERSDDGQGDGHLEIAIGPERGTTHMEGFFRRPRRAVA